MRDLHRRNLGAYSLAASLGALFVLLAAPAHAITVPLSFEFDAGVEGDFGSVRVTENGTGGLFFEITTGPDLGPDPDLHYFYFNLTTAVDDLEISSDDDVFTDYSLDTGWPVAGGAGSSFDHSVFFGNGGGRKGNGTLESATFTLVSASGDLDLDGLAELSETSGGLETFFAVHVQNTGLFGGGSETIGGDVIIPEPSSLALLATGLLGLAGLGRRRPRS